MIWFIYDYLVLSMANTCLHDQPIHVQKLLSLTVDCLEMKLYRNVSNMVL